MAGTKGTSTKDTRAGDATAWSDEERAAMKEHAAELKRAGGKGAAKRAEEAQACLDKIAEMPDADRVLAERVHAIVTSTVADPVVKTYYGMPAYAREDGKVVCWFKSAAKFKTRYATIGFSDQAALDDGDLWPTEYAVTALGAAEAEKVTSLVRKAFS
ncbi:MAG TPA: hypothetical protein VFJ89_02480 [Nocardioides sp.]|jgi:uncharacterized protein YdhG (YjbR/CyaY superfamily)|nr:hypothetical protein [Nocardioides sp.]